MLNQEELFKLLEKTLKYTTLNYNQSAYTSNSNEFDNNFLLEYKYSEVAEDSLLFFTPTVSSREVTENTPCRLTIKLPTTVVRNGVKTIEYTQKVYSIVVETNDGRTRNAMEGDIIASRMCVFRFRKNQNVAVLCNSPLYNDAKFSNLVVTNCQFLNTPTVLNPLTGETIYLVTSSDFKKLQEEVSQLKEKIIFGTEDPDTALADKPAGTVYIQVEED